MSQVSATAVQQNVSGLSRGELRARLAIERGVQNVRGLFIIVGAFQAVVEARREPSITIVMLGLLAIAWLTIRIDLSYPLTRRRLNRIAISSIVIDTFAVFIAMAYLLDDPMNPVVIVPIVIAAEGAVRWERLGGTLGGAIGGLLTIWWSIASQRQAELEITGAFLTFRPIVMIGFGYFMGLSFESLRRAKRKAEALAEGSHDLITTMTTEGTIRNINPAVRSILGYEPEDLIGRNIAEIMLDLDGDSSSIVNSLNSRNLLEVRMAHRAGYDVWLEASMESDRSRTQLYVIARDVSDRRRAEDELRRRAEHDPLTGLKNRAYLMSVLERRLKDRAPSHLLFIDLDGFKQINDRFGHREGDQVLRQAAQRLRSVAAPDDVVVRLSGDEFCVLLGAGSNDMIAQQLLLNLESGLNSAFNVAGVDTVLSASVGWAASSSGDRPVDLLERADLDMYAAKRDHHMRLAEGELN